MKKIVLLLTIFLFSGCLVRTYTIRKPRTDLDITGNRGYLSGSPSSADADLKRTRPYTIFEVEFGPSTEERKEYINVRRSKQEEMTPDEGVVISTEEDNEFSPKEDDVFQEEMSFEEELVYPEEEYTMYTIQKGDTLQKISQKFYGTTRKWKMIFNENQVILKSPNQIRPGKQIKIPLFN